MGKIRLIAPRVAAAVLVSGLAACQSGQEPITLDEAQETELAGYVQSYHRCVARMAVRLDDGRTAIVGISGMAMTFCRPEAQIVAAFLNTTPLPDEVKLDYVAHLLSIAANNSALMLRRRRDLEGAMEDI